MTTKFLLVTSGIRPDGCISAYAKTESGFVTLRTFSSGSTLEEWLRKQLMSEFGGALVLDQWNATDQIGALMMEQHGPSVDVTLADGRVERGLRDTVALDVYVALWRAFGTVVGRVSSGAVLWDGTVTVAGEGT